MFGTLLDTRLDKSSDSAPNHPLNANSQLLVPVVSSDRSSLYTQLQRHD